MKLNIIYSFFQCFEKDTHTHTHTHTHTQTNIHTHTQTHTHTHKHTSLNSIYEAFCT